MANQNSNQEKLRLGIEAARRGDKPAAEMLLRQVTVSDPQNEMAWLWLASVVSDVTERRRYLEKVVTINPDNTRAQEALQRLTGGQARPEGRQVVGQLRPSTPAVSRPTQPSNRPNMGLLALVALVVVLVVAALIFSIVFLQESSNLGLPTDVSVESVFNPTETVIPPTIDPADYTATPFYGIIVTVDREAQNLPPTFTPTAEPSPEPTAIPSATPFPQEDFQMIYASLGGGDAQPRLVVARGDGSSAAQHEEGFRDVVYSPSGELIAFVRDIGVDPNGDVISELFIAPATAPNNARQVTEIGARTSSPTWAANNIQLAFANDISGNNQIWLITEDGNNIRQLTEDAQYANFDPAWSLAEDRIAFASDRESPGLTQIFTIDSNGENLQQLTSASGNSYQPRWSPDGQHITYVNDGGGDGDIYIMDLNGHGALLLTADDGEAEDRKPAFTPDGQAIAFVSNRSSENFQIYLMNLRGDILQRLTETDRNDQSVDFRPELIFRLRGN